jgi:hypothetical protein
LIAGFFASTECPFSSKLRKFAPKGSPFMTKGSPFNTKGSPFTAKGHPFTSKGCLFVPVVRSFAATGCHSAKGGYFGTKVAAQCFAFSRWGALLGGGVTPRRGGSEKRHRRLERGVGLAPQSETSPA